MSSRAWINRPVSAAEAAVIRAALERAPTDPAFATMATRVDGLHAVGRCECGCDSVDFAPANPEQSTVLLADGIGTTAAGGTVGVIVWGTTEAVTSLEIYDLGAGDDDIRLPVPASIRALVTEQ
jgi:hypothetical protein